MSIGLAVVGIALSRSQGIGIPDADLELLAHVARPDAEVNV